MLNAGFKPSSWSSSLTGLAQSIYSQRLSDGVYQSESQLTETIDGTTYTEKDSDRQARVFKAKLESWSLAEGVINEITSNAEVNNISSIINDSMPSTFVPQDGGATAFTTFSVTLGINNPLKKGSIS